MKAPNYFEFFSQAKIMSGKKGLEQIVLELEGMAANRPLVLTSDSVTSAGLTKTFIKAMYESTVTIGALYDEVTSSTSGATAERLAALYTWKQCDSIIAIGNASVMDMARAVNMLVSLEGTLTDYAGRDAVPSSLKPFVAIPTSEISGYEMSNRAIIDNRVYQSDFLYPDIVCIDGRMLKGGNPETIVNAGMCALVRAIDASGEEVANPMKDAYSLLAIRAVSENLPVAAAKPKNKAALLALANGSAAADIAWSNSPAGLAGSLAHALAEETGFPEGILGGIILSSVLKFKQSGKAKLRDDLLFALAGFDAAAAVPAGEKSAASLAMISELVESLGDAMPSTLQALNVPRFKMERAAEKAAAMADVKIKADQCLEILSNAYDGSGLR